MFLPDNKNGLLFLDENNKILFYDNGTITSFQINEIIFENFLFNKNSNFFWKKIEKNIDNNYIMFSNNSIIRKKTKIKKIIVHPKNTIYDSRDNCNAIIHTKTNKMIFGCTNTHFPISVTHIGAGCFYHNFDKNLKSYTIPENIQYIDDLAFSQCFYLKSIIIKNKKLNRIADSVFAGDCSLENIDIQSNNINCIEEDAFYGTKITTLKMPDNLEYINDGAFFKCKNLISLEIPKNVKYIYSNVFLNCSSLKKIIFNSINTKIHISNKPILMLIDVYIKQKDKQYIISTDNILFNKMFFD